MQRVRRPAGAANKKNHIRRLRRSRHTFDHARDAPSIVTTSLGAHLSERSIAPTKLAWVWTRDAIHTDPRRVTLPSERAAAADSSATAAVPEPAPLTYLLVSRSLARFLRSRAPRVPRTPLQADGAALYSIATIQEPMHGSVGGGSRGDAREASAWPDARRRTAAACEPSRGHRTHSRTMTRRQARMRRTVVEHDGRPRRHDSRGRETWTYARRDP